MGRYGSGFRSARRQGPPTLQIPERGFNHPFHDAYYGVQGREHPRTIVELRMCALSHYIREKSEWWEKMKNRGILNMWGEEALKQTGDDEHPEWKLTPRMVKYVLQELQGYADLRDPETGMEVGPGERIWRSDKLIPDSLREKLQAAVAPLESVPDSERDWHPGSDGLVLALVHPSLFPIVYGRTIAKLPGSTSFAPLGPPEFTDSNPRFASEQFQWMPSDFFVDHTGKVTLTSPFINNIHPTRHKELYSVIPEVLQHAVPMFERVLSDLLRPLLPMRIATSGRRTRNGEKTADCIWEHQNPYPFFFGQGDGPSRSNQRDFKTPDARESYGRELGVMKNQISLKGRTLQIIVKLANIVLTPERSQYPGGKWHIEGMRNEKIVSSFIYYYDSENISESRLAFRRATSEPEVHGRDDGECMRVLYDMARYSTLVQDIGDVVTKSHRCVAFPNLYQHQVRPFQLEDPTKPGHRKILVFFLVDPAQRIPSATDVGFQQREWVDEVMHNAGVNSAFAKLPTEILTMISEENDGIMSRAEAEVYRKGLMAERSAFITQNNESYFGMEFAIVWYMVCLRGD